MRSEEEEEWGGRDRVGKSHYRNDGRGEAAEDEDEEDEEQI